MTTIDLKLQIEQSIKNFSHGNLRENGIRLLQSLGYHSNRQVVIHPNTFEGFLEIHPLLGKIDKTKALVDHWLSVDILFQLTGEEIRKTTQGFFVFDNHPIDNQIIESYLFLAIELTSENYTRTKLANISREVNKLFAMPVMILFKYGSFLTVSIINRRLNKRDSSKDVLEKVTLIKDINTEKPVRAHIEILFDLSLSELEKAEPINNFVELHRYWQKTLDISELNKRFYREVASWYFYAVEHVEFPKGTIDDRKTRNATNMIRLITRLIFVWFIKEKGLVPDVLFNINRLKEIVAFNDPQNSTYYKAILQNLFFATLNTVMGSERSFRGKNKNPKGLNPHFGITTLYRYEDYFFDSQKGLDLFAGIPFLNGGLFECLDKREKGILVDGFSDDPRNQPFVPDQLFFGEEITVDMSDVYGDNSHNKEKVRGLIRILESYKFTVEENTPLDEEVALDPELLGKVFENLLAAFNPETGTTARKQTGSFYTPREIVNFMVDESLIAYLKKSLHPQEIPNNEKTELERRLRHLLSYNHEPHQFDEEEVNKIIFAIGNIKVLDPACGSGAFPMGILQKLVFILNKLDPENVKWKEFNVDKAKQAKKKTDSTTAIEDIEKSFAENEMDYGRKLYLIEKCIYGVDIQPIAVQIAKLRFFISLIVDQKIDRSKSNLGVRPLPNLESKFVAANTLIEIEKPIQMSFSNPLIDDKQEQLAEIRDLLFKARTTETKRKYRDQDKTLRKEITELLKTDGWNNTTAIRLSNWDPFDQNASSNFFDPEWMFGVKNGFDIILGNPPYIQLQTMHEKADEIQRIGFQTFARTGDIYCLFYEKGYQLLKENGILALITSNKWMRAGYGEALRKFLAENTNPLVLIDFAGQKIFESATVDVNILIIEKARNRNKTKSCKITESSAIEHLSVFIEQNCIISEYLSKQTWIILSDMEQRIKRKIEEAGTPLKDWDISINRGILTGYNEAFIISGQKKDELISADPKSAEIIRPILRGKDIKRYGYSFADLWLINSHNGIAKTGEKRVNINEYPAIKRHLEKYYSNLEKRFDQGDTPYNLRSCDYLDDFSKQKIIYPETTQGANFMLDNEGFYAEKTCFFLLSENPEYLLATFSSSLFEYAYRRFFSSIELGENGYQYNKHAFVLLPVIKPKNISETSVSIIRQHVVEIIKEKDLLKQNEIFKAINEIIFEIYNISKQEAIFIEELKT